LNSIELLKGVIPPIVTPLKDNTERIDKESMGKIVESLIKNGVHGIFALGSCGEYTGFDKNRKEEIVDFLTEIINKRVPLLVGITETSTNKVLQLYSKLKSYKPDFLVLSPPFYYYYSPSQIEQYYQTIADKVEIPIVVYNIPHLTKNDIDIKTLSLISQHPNIVGIKDSSGDFVKFQDTLYLFKSDKFKVFQGIEKLSLVSLLIGADGLVPGLANLIPKSFCDLYDISKKRKNCYDAVIIQKMINKLASIYEFDPWIGGLKQAMEFLDLCKNIPCLPYLPVNEESKNSILEIIKTIDRTNALLKFNTEKEKGVII
jgi:dihydrodipicolinate synthase/N-acetylneuraminate lyase